VEPGLRALWRGHDEALAEIALPAVTSTDGYGIHPSLLDAALQATAAMKEQGEGELLLPFEMGSVTVYRHGVEMAWAHVVLGKRREG